MCVCSDRLEISKGRCEVAEIPHDSLEMRLISSHPSSANLSPLLASRLDNYTDTGAESASLHSVIASSSCLYTETVQRCGIT